MWSRISTLASALLFAASIPAMATDYFVSPYGADFFPGTSSNAPWSSLSRVNSADLRSGDHVYFLRGGTWRGTLQPKASGVTFGAYGTGNRPVISGADLAGGLLPIWLPVATNAWTTLVASAPSQLWYDGVRGTKVASRADVKAPMQWYYANNQLTVYATTYPALKYKAPGIEIAVRNNALLLNNLSNVTVEHLALVNTSDAAACLCGTTNGQTTFTDDILSGAANSGLSVLSGAANLATTQVLYNGAGLVVKGGEGITVNQSLFSGNRRQAVWLQGSSGVSTITSSTLSGNSTDSVTSEVVTNSTGQALTVSNSLLLPNPYQPKVFNFSGLTDAGNNTYQSPAFTKRAAPFIVVPFIDDYNNLPVAQAVAAAAQSYGCTLSYALNTKLVTPAAWQQIAALQKSGVEIVAHTRSHSDLANNNVFTIQYTGSATTAVMTINQKTGLLQTFLNGASTPDLSLDISDTYNGVIDVLNRIPAGSPYAVSIQTNQNYFTPINLAEVANVNIKSAPYMAVASANYLNWEIQGAQSDLQANLPGVPVTAFATPFTSSSSAVEDHIRDAGFASNRNGLLTAASQPNGQWLLSTKLDVYNMAAEWLPVAYDETKPASSAGALVEGLGASGGVMAVYSHGYDEFSLQSWTDLFASLKQLGATCMTMSQANAYVESKGQLIPDGTKKNWIQTVPLTPKYTLTQASPSQGETQIVP